MSTGGTLETERKYRVYTQKNLQRIPQLESFRASELRAMRAVATVLPFRVNSYVIDELIDWDAVPDDPMFQLTFPQPGMLAPKQLGEMTSLLRRGASEEEIRTTARSFQETLRPHPGGQVQLNTPIYRGEPVAGMQHKYRETVLFFPAPGQTCHAYCSYCFRWAQFVGIDELKFANREAESLVRYVRAHPEVTSVLLTGGDPLVMKTRVLRRYVEPLLSRALPHVQSIRIGTKAPAFWPYRFVTDPDADDLLRLFDEVVASGRHLALMAHYSHPRELQSAIAQEALRRIRRTGAVVRCQAPLIRHVNDSARTWMDLWRLQTRLGAVPYYMFVQRDTGAHRYFEVPLARALKIYNRAFRRVSGLARTARGPVMSAAPGKVLLDGVTTLGGEDVFLLKLLQARDPNQVGKPFFARFDPKATWFDDLQPALGQDRFFFDKAGSPRHPHAGPLRLTTD